MTKLHEIRTILEPHKDYLYRSFDVKSLGIFGSFARNEQTINSDIDILVEFNRPIGLQFVDLAEYLEQLLHMKVDLVSKQSLKPKMLESISEELHVV